MKKTCGLTQQRSTQRKVPIGRAGEDALTADIIIALANRMPSSGSRHRPSVCG